MSVSWTSLPVEVPNLAELTTVLDAFGTVSEGVSAALHVASVGASAMQATVQEADGFVSSASVAALATMEQTLLSLLRHQVGLCVHMNAVWDPEWKLADFESSSRLPWLGNGLAGWAGAVATSAVDPTDGFAPLSDPATRCGGFIAIQSGSDLGVNSKLLSVYKLFRSMAADEALFEPSALQALLSQASSPQIRGLLRLGPACLDKTFQNAAGKLVQPPSLNFLGASDLTGTGFVPRRGAYPKWRTASLAHVFPGVDQVVHESLGAISSIKPADLRRTGLTRLTTLLNVKASGIDTAVTRAREGIADLARSLEFLSDVSFIVLPMAAGGVQGMLSRALAAGNLPEIGDKDFVAGVVGVATDDAAMAQMEAFWQLIGVRWSELGEDATSRATNLSALFESLF